MKRTKPGALARRLVCAIIAIVVATGVVAVENVLIWRYLPRFERVGTDYSPAYLQRELDWLAVSPAQTIFLGDSVLWGYLLAPGQSAVAILRQGGCPCINLAFKSGSPPNYYTLMRLFERSGIRPKGVVLEINQRVFNAADVSYRSVHPAIAALGASLLSPGDRALLTLPAKHSGQKDLLDRWASAASVLYAMRTDIREGMYGELDGGAVTRPTPAMFEGTYDLAPLDGQNVGVRFLAKTLDLLRARGIPVLAFMTPTNHALLHDYIDVPEYQANKSYLARLLSSRGVRVLDLDSAFGPSDFFDNDHLKAPAQRRLAGILERGLER